jgi:hypothetical protein
MNVIYDDDLDEYPYALPKLDLNQWDSAMMRFPHLPSHIRLIIKSIEKSHYRFDFIIQRTEEGWDKSCVVSWRNEYCVYDWDTNVKRIPSFISEEKSMSMVSGMISR